MPFRRYVGFIKEDQLGGIDPDFRELSRLCYQTPGFATYGVSCSGHFYPEYDQDKFYPSFGAHLGIITLPEMDHIPELLEIIYNTTKEDPDAEMKVKEKMKGPKDLKKYSPGFDLKPYSYGQNKDGLYVAWLEIRLNDNGALDSISDHWAGPIKLEGNKEVFEKSKQRYSEIQAFWKKLEDKVRNYNLKHGFSETDFEKKEFLPFR